MKLKLSEVCLPIPRTWISGELESELPGFAASTLRLAEPNSAPQAAQQEKLRLDSESRSVFVRAFPVVMVGCPVMLIRVYGPANLNVVTLLTSTSSRINATTAGPGLKARVQVVVSGIGTDRPARQRPAALDRPGTSGRARARRAPAVARGDKTDVDESAQALDKMPYSGELGSQRAVSRKEQLTLLLLSAVSRNQAAALASDQKERQRFLLTGESDIKRRREARVSAGGQNACSTPDWPCR